MTPQKILQAVNTFFENAVITTDVGQNQLWTTQFLEITSSKRLLTSGGLGTMGYGLPAAIGARLGCPDREVIAICGDGTMRLPVCIGEEAARRPAIRRRQTAPLMCLIL